jgi:hypothetical protein
MVQKALSLSWSGSRRNIRAKTEFELVESITGAAIAAALADRRSRPVVKSLWLGGKYLGC